MISANVSLLMTVMFCAASPTTAAVAQSDQAVPEPSSNVAQPSAQHGAQDDLLPNESRLLLTITPYLWLTSYDGTITVQGREADVEVSFSDIVDDADSLLGIMGAIDIVYERFVFQFNATYSTVEFSDERTRGRVDPGGGGGDTRIDVDLGLDTAILEILGGYRFVDMPLGDAGTQTTRLRLDGFVGCRYTYLDVDARLKSDTTVTLPNGNTIEGGRSFKADSNEDWFEPFIGARLSVDLSDNWSLGVRGDIGGFDIDHSDFAWQTIAYISYRWRLDGWDLTLHGGYRALSQDYSNGDFEFDVITHGPLLGLSLTWSF